jgi:hypothetical protein
MDGAPGIFRMENINLKFNWARGHFTLFNSEQAEYLKVDPCKFVAKPEITMDADGRHWVKGTFEEFIPVPQHFPLIVGDCLGNLRSTLDYLVWELVLAEGKKPTIRNQFPIAHTPEAFKDEIRGDRLKGVHPDAVAIIDSLQPYHLAVPDESQLSILNKLVNINKHRRILLTCLKTIQPIPMIEIEGQAFAQVNPPTFQGNAEFGPFEVFGDQVKVQTDYIAYVAFNEAPAEGFSVSGMMQAIGDCLNDIVFPKFERFL